MKTAINVWIHEYYQEFRRPCLLEPDHENVTNTLP